MLHGAHCPGVPPFALPPPPQITCETTAGLAGTYTVAVTTNGESFGTYWGYSYSSDQTPSEERAFR